MPSEIIKSEFCKIIFDALFPYTPGLPKLSLCDESRISIAAQLKKNGRLNLLINLLAKPMQSDILTPLPSHITGLLS